jgi:hypothetical protein
MGRVCSTSGENRNANGTLMGRKEGKTERGMPRCRLVDNIKMDLRTYWVVRTGLVWLTTRTAAGLLCTR